MRAKSHTKNSYEFLVASVFADFTEVKIFEVAVSAATFFFEKAYEFAVATSLAFFDINLFTIIKYKVYKKRYKSL